MFRFQTPQKIFQIGNVKIGGQPGESPTVLIGSIFYHGQKIIHNENKGVFDKEAAEKLIKLQEEFSDKTGNPCMLDVIGVTKESITKHIDFVTKVTDSPFLLDSPSVETRIAGLKYVADVGLEDRVIYNSLTLDSKASEFDALMENRVKSAILLTYERGFIGAERRVVVLKEILKKAEKAGIANPLIDTYVIDVPSLSLSCRAAFNIKKEFGLPCGSGAHNAVSSWTGLAKLMGKQAVPSVETTAIVMPVILGLDFILYGPIERCEYVFPSIHTIDTTYRYLVRMKERVDVW
jgi:tetrahydromethanopterin S-methyltransferase subunit H